jgi:hypothetical protein
VPMRGVGTLKPADRMVEKSRPAASISVCKGAARWRDEVAIQMKAQPRHPPVTPDRIGRLRRMC